MLFLKAVAVLLLAGTAVLARPAMDAATSRATAVGPKVFVSPTGSDDGICSRAAPCLTLERAFRQATPGDTVQVADGTYTSGQTLVYDPSKASAKKRVVFAPAPGAHPVFTSGIQLAGAQHIEFVGLELRRERFCTAVPALIARQQQHQARRAIRRSID